VRPRLACGVRVRPDPRDGTPVLLSPERGLRLSPSAGAVVSLCDGVRDFAELVSALCERYPRGERARIETDVRGLLEDLRARGLVEGVDASAPGPKGTGPAEDARAVDPSKAPDASPYTLVAELTHRCPLACPYCSNPRDLVGGRDELTTEEWLGVVDDAAALGVMQMHLSGGEPLARSDVEVIAARGRARDLYVSLVTSGVPLERARLERLAPHLDHVQLSVQDADPQASDRIASFRAFEHKMRVAAWVKELALPLTINVVLHRENIDHVDDVIALAERLGADRARAAATQAKQRLDGKMQVVFVLPDWYADRPRACMDGWARRFVVVAPDGAVLPCHAARALPLAFETVRSRPLRTVWAEGQALRAFRGSEWMPEPCRSCDRRDVDFGGCRCQAFALTGDVRATDPACSLSPDHAIILGARAGAERPAERRLVFRGR
jgi:pyrroloquinoline quinone biosynthesis protein E